MQKSVIYKTIVSHPSMSGIVLSLICTCFLLTYWLLQPEPYQPLHLLDTQHYPQFTDDLSRSSLLAVAASQASRLKRLAPEQTLAILKQGYTNRLLLESVEDFIALLKRNPESKELATFLRDNYQVFQAGGRKGKGSRKMLVTGYYEPLFAADLQKNSPYLYPIYKKPSQLKTIKEQDGSSKTGRFDQKNNFIPFWSREEIEKQGLLAGNELAYLKDPFDAYLLHVQGSGRLRLPDQSIIAVRYAASNGLKYNSIGKLLVDEQRMRLEDVNIPAIRKYLAENPGEQQRILHHNPRYIFFSQAADVGAKGSSGEILTPGRSIAIDPRALPDKTIAYLCSEKPQLDENGSINGWSEFCRFVFPQDSGSAIQGTGRVDIFWGSDNYGKAAASHMAHEGKLYFLVKRTTPGGNSP